MKIIIGERGTGKTTQLIHTSEATGFRILTNTEENVKLVREQKIIRMGDRECTFTANTEAGQFKRFFDANLNLSPTYDIQYCVLKQARKHKKKRINKKWLKRYGFKKEMKISKGWEADYYQNGEVGLTKIGDVL